MSTTPPVIRPDADRPHVVTAHRMMMHFCCGIDVVGNFDEAYDNPRRAHNRLPVEALGGQIHGLLLASTVGYQKEANRILEQQGWKKVCDFWNDVHASREKPRGNLVTLWMKHRGNIAQSYNFLP